MAPPSSTSSSSSNGDQHVPFPCTAHADCSGSGPRCSPCVDYRKHSCSDWGDSITGSCDVCTTAGASGATPDDHEQQEQEAVLEAIAAPIYGKHGELRSMPSPPPQSGAGRKDFLARPAATSTGKQTAHMQQQ